MTMTTIGQDEAAQAMAERDPLPQEVTYHVWTADEPAAGLQGERAEVRMFVAEPNDYVRTTLAETFAKVWCAQSRHVRVMREEPPERTPETVLRAMLRAYDAAALDACIAYYRAPDHSPSEKAAYARWRDMSLAMEDIRDELAITIVGRQCGGAIEGTVLADYQQRLSGARNMNAPPLEVS